MSTERETELVTVLNDLVLTLREVIKYHIPETHPDYVLAMDEIQQAEEVAKGAAE